jgi:hypothetical protein
MMIFKESNMHRKPCIITKKQQRQTMIWITYEHLENKTSFVIIIPLWLQQGPTSNTKLLHQAF